MQPYNAEEFVSMDELKKRIAEVRKMKHRLRLQLMRECNHIDKEELEQFTLGSLRRAVFEGDTKTGSLMSGQVAGMLHEIRPAAQILEDLWAGAQQRIKALQELC